MSVKESCNKRPLDRKLQFLIQSNRLYLMTLWDHVVVVHPFEHIRIREVERFSEYDLLICPLHFVLADRESDFSLHTLLSLPIDFKEHVPGMICFNHEG